MRAPIFAIVCVTAAACGGDPSPDPSATVLSATPATLHPTDDTRNDLAIQISYADGDGDLGRGVARIHDCRTDGVVTELRLPAIASDEAVADGVAITGMLDLRVNDIGEVASTGTVPAACSELGAPALAVGQAVFCVVLVDAAGHTGPGDCTDTIAIATP